MRVGLAAAIMGLWLQSAPTPAIAVREAARSIQPGELVVLTLTTADPAERVTVRAFDHDLTPFRLGPDTWRVLVGIDLDVVPGPYTVTIDATTASGSTSHAVHRLAVTTKAFPTRTLTVNEAFVNPPAAEAARIEREARDLDNLWSHSAPTRLWTTGFVRPVPDPSNSAFGSRSVFNGQARNPHGGADFLSGTGTPIGAPNAGRVVLARDLYFTGNTVIIDHGLGLFSTLAHMSAIQTHEGDVVTAGTIVGLVGATGRVTGPHLHWGVRLAGARIDPLALLAMLGREPQMPFVQ